MRHSFLSEFSSRPIVPEGFRSDRQVPIVARGDSCGWLTNMMRLEPSNDVFHSGVAVLLTSGAEPLSLVA